MATDRSIDVDAIRERISRMVELLDLKASAFADTTMLPRTTVSNILNGKTNATIEVVNKILQAFPDWSASWLLFGIEPKRGYDPLTTAPGLAVERDLFEASPKQIEPNSSYYGDAGTQDLNPAARSDAATATPSMGIPTVIQLPAKEIEKIMVFYSDNSYQTYYPEK